VHAGKDLSWRERFACLSRSHLIDHAFLRLFWTNLHEIAPGVWRSNQPSASRVRRYARHGIRAILNLRGTPARLSGGKLAERAAVRSQIGYHTIAISARTLASTQVFLDLLDLFDRIERPFVMHCKSGADRTGLAAAFWLIHCEGRPVEEAQAMLSLRFLHMPSSKAGIAGFLLQDYAARCAIGPISLRDWLSNHYDQARILAMFKADRQRKRFPVQVTFRRTR
jgi:protein tyrosine/serine phosphatase